MLTSCGKRSRSLTAEIWVPRPLDHPGTSGSFERLEDAQMQKMLCRRLAASRNASADAGAFLSLRGERSFATLFRRQAHRPALPLKYLRRRRCAAADHLSELKSGDAVAGAGAGAAPLLDAPLGSST